LCQAKLQAAKEEKEKELTKMAAQWDKKEKSRVADNKAKVEALNKKVSDPDVLNLKPNLANQKSVIFHH